MLKGFKHFFDRIKEKNMERHAEFEVVYAGPDIDYRKDRMLPDPHQYPEVLTVGRGPNCDIIIFNDRTVSREHCQLKRVSGVDLYYIRDLEAVNGTFVNNRRIGTEWTELQAGDIIKIGDAVFSFEKEHAELTTLNFKRNIY